MLERIHWKDVGKTTSSKILLRSLEFMLLVFIFIFFFAFKSKTDGSDASSFKPYPPKSLSMGWKDSSHEFHVLLSSPIAQIKAHTHCFPLH